MFGLAVKGVRGFGGGGPVGGGRWGGSVDTRFMDTELVAAWLGSGLNGFEGSVSLSGDVSAKIWLPEFSDSTRRGLLVAARE